MASSSSSAHREPLVPTINFSMVCPGVYRSGYPTKKNYSFLCALRLRSVLYLCPEDYAESNLKFCEENGIHVLRFPTEGNKEPFNDISEPLMHRILGALCDTRNLPLLIHCNKGKHRTGTVVACLRHLQGWSLVSIFEEYKRFASDKARVGDQQYVELYHPIVKLTPPFVAPWVSLTPRVTLVTSDRELMEAESIQLGTSLLAPDKPVKKAGGKNGGGGGGSVAALPIAATAPAAATVLPSASSLPPPPSPNLQPSPATAAPPPQLPSGSTQPAPSSASGSTPAASAAAAGGGNSMSASLPPTPPPASTTASAAARPQMATPLPVHAIMGGSGTRNPAPAATTTTTNVMTNTTAMAGDGGNSGAGAATGTTTSSSGAPTNGMSPSTSWHSPTAAPPSTAFTALPNRSSHSQGGGSGGGGGTSGGGGSTGSGVSNNAIPPLDADMQL